jgi:uncharacterized protein (TIGR02118 family)
VDLPVPSSDHEPPEPAMIKLSFFVRRLPTVQRAEFHAYWRERHAALIRKHAAIFGIQRYVQIHASEDPRNKPAQSSLPPYDGVAELWFRSPQHLESWFHNTTPEAVAAGKEIRDDERKFIDRASSPLVIGEEEIIIDEA